MQEVFAADVPRRRRDKPSRLSRSTATGDQAKGKSGVDRFHYLFEAIEADKASDSETGNEGPDSQEAGLADDAQGPSAPEQAVTGKGANAVPYLQYASVWREGRLIMPGDPPQLRKQKQLS